jgi:hypothetical protein
MKRFLSWARRPRAGAAGNILTLLVVICLTAGGTAYAANTIGSSDIIDNSVQGVDIKDRTIRPPDLVGAPWISVLPASGAISCGASPGRFCSSPDGSTSWQNYQNGYQGARFRRDATNTVTLQGRVSYVQHGPLITTAFVLPVNYRPSGNLVFPVNCGDLNLYDISGAIQISTGGVVDWYHNDKCVGAWFDLSGISFPIN